MSSRTIAQCIIIPAIICVMAIAIYRNLTTVSQQQYILQANYLLQGKLHIVDIVNFGYLDTSLSAKNGLYYWPLGIFPSILIIPFNIVATLIGITLRQGYVQVAITPLTIFYAFLLAKKKLFSTMDALYLGFAFCFSSIYILSAFIPWSWYFAHAVAVLLLMMALYELHHKKRWLYIGILMGLLLHTRPLSAISALVFIWEALQTPTYVGKKKSLLYLLSPIAIGIGWYLLLNYVRFGSLFDTGYTRALVNDPQLIAARNIYGFFNIVNIPKNIYWYFFAFLNPIVDPVTNHIVWPYGSVNMYGLGFFYISPIFLSLFLPRKFDTSMVHYWVVSICILSILLTHYTSGYWTFGPRYMMDLLPLWYMLLLNSIEKHKLTVIHCIVIIVSGILNLLIISNVPQFYL